MEQPRIALARLKPWPVVMLAVSLLALLLRLHRLGRESLWLDEGFSWRRARLPLEQLVTDAIGAHHNPSYFILLRYWMQLGDDEFMLRLPSAIGGTLAVATTAALGCTLRGPVAGFVAGLLLALAPVHIRFSQETRMYALLSWSATVAAAGLVWLAMHPERAARPILGTTHLQRWRWRAAAGSGARAPDGASEAAVDPSLATLAWAAYVGGMIVTLYLHNTAVVFAATAGCAALLGWVLSFRSRLGFLINFVAANLLVLVGWAPYLGTQLAQAQHFSNSYFWAKLPTARELEVSARELYLLTADLDAPLALLLTAAAVLGLWSLRKRPEVALSMVCLAVFGPVVLYLISLQKPIFGTRLLLWTTPPFFALVGAGVAELGERRVWLSWAGALVFAGAVAWWVRPTLAEDYEQLTNEPWREVAWTVRSRVIPGARILTATSEEATMLDYYMHRRSHPLFDVPLEIARKRAAWKQVRDAPRAWLIDRKAGRRSSRARRELTERGQLVWDRSWNERLRVVQIDIDRR
jgi:mannosyltransferase